MNDGTFNLNGVATDAVTYLGNGYIDLYGYGPILQGILGAAAYCEFIGDVGGEWPDPSTLWLPLNYTTNVVFGPVLNNRPPLSTVLLNYGPGRHRVLSRRRSVSLQRSIATTVDFRKL